MSESELLHLWAKRIKESPQKIEMPFYDQIIDTVEDWAPLYDKVLLVSEKRI